MRQLLIAIAIATTALIQPAHAQVSVSVGQPGFYGRIDIGGFPAPPLLFPEPIMVRPVPPGRPPLYLRVPPGHAKHWHKYCHQYRACGEPVYFVRDDWYRREYVPMYRERHGGPHPRHDYRYDDRYDRRGGDYDRGPGRDHDRGHGHGPRH